MNAQAIKIVAADDDPTTLAVIEHALAKDDFDLTVAEDGLQALERITEQTEVLLLDLDMPRMDGHECLRRVRADYPFLQIIMITVSQEISDAVAAMKQGAFDYVTKPIDPEPLIALIRQAVQRGREKLELSMTRQRLQEIELRKRAILEASLDTIISIDEKGRIIEINPAAEMTLGYSKEDLLGEPIVDRIFPPSSRERYREAIHQFIMLGDEGSRLGKRHETTLMRADGSQFPGELAFVPIRLDGLQVFTAFLRDITDRKRNQETIARANVRMRADLEAAAKIQNSLLPHRLPATRRVEIAWEFHPCQELAGDHLNVVRLDDDHLGIYLLDVSGHGVSAALLSVTLTHLLASHPDQSPLVEDEGGPNLSWNSPAELFHQLNQRFQLTENVGRQYFTITYGVLNQNTGRLTLAQAGHPYAVLQRRGQPMEFLEKGGLAIGFTRDAQYEEMELTLSPGDRLVLYSDGILETLDGEAQHFGLDGLRAAVERHRDKPLSTSLKELLLDVNQWRGRSEPDDDVSILALEWKDSDPGEH